RLQAPRPGGPPRGRDQGTGARGERGGSTVRLLLRHGLDALVRDENPQTVRDLLCLGRSARNAYFGVIRERERDQMLAGITEWILSLNGWFALAIVFIVPALEASAFLGFLFPGEIAVILGGVLAFNGRVPLPPVIAAAVVGAIVGDTVGYFVGRRWGNQLLRGVGRRVPFLRHRMDEHLASA